MTDFYAPMPDETKAALEDHIARAAQMVEHMIEHGAPDLAAPGIAPATPFVIDQMKIEIHERLLTQRRWRRREHGVDGELWWDAKNQRSVIWSIALVDGVHWMQASLARRDHIPDYTELCELHTLFMGSRFAVQQFVPPDEHVNIHPRALHLWARADGHRLLPDFSGRAEQLYGQRSI